MNNLNIDPPTWPPTPDDGDLPEPQPSDGE